MWREVEGCGKGALIAQIVKAYPHIHGIDFDPPHVIATAPSISGEVSCRSILYITRLVLGLAP